MIFMLVNRAVAEQVTEVKGAETVYNLWQQGVWGAVLPRSCTELASEF